MTYYVRKDRRLNTDLRFALVSELAHVPGPTDTYGPYCVVDSSQPACIMNVWVGPCNHRVTVCVNAQIETLSEVLSNWFVPVIGETQAKTLLQP